MPRIARVVASGIPHHVTQRGNRRQKTFFSDDDYEAYKSLMSEWCVGYGVEIWAYCLMPNHVHLIAVPGSEEGLRRAIGEAHRRYTRRVNFMKGWRGCLWQGRFSSYPMDETHLLTAARYVEMNPVRARLSRDAKSYPWSSARAHLSGRDDGLATVEPLLEIAGDWKEFLSERVPKEEMAAIRRCSRTGRPLGDKNFIARLEKLLDRDLMPQKPGPKSKE